MNELAQELIDLQAVCERLGVDDDDVLYRAADSIVKLEAQLDKVRRLKPFVLGDDKTFVVYYDELQAILEDKS